VKRLNNVTPKLLFRILVSTY